MITHNGVEWPEIASETEEMDPNIEDLLFADELADGMRVLLPTNLRAIAADTTPIENLMKNNRWCNVTKFRVEGPNVYFIGVYDDDSKAIRSSQITAGWIVKKYSMPKIGGLIPSDTDGNGYPSWVERD